MGEPRKDPRRLLRRRPARRTETAQDAGNNTVGGNLQQNTGGTNIGRDQNINIIQLVDEQGLEQARRLWDPRHHPTPSDEDLPGQPPGAPARPGSAPHPTPVHIGAGTGDTSTTSRAPSRRTVLLGGGATLAAAAGALVAARLTGTDGKKVQGPKPLSDRNAFRKAGFTTRIDAVMQTPDNVNEYWVFSGSHFIRINVAGGKNHTDTVEQGLRPLSNWGAFSRSSPQFTTQIDAVMRTPDNVNEYWVFSGSQFIRIHVAGGENHIDTVVQAPMPLRDWGAFSRSSPQFTSRIDAVARTPDNVNEYWVFSGAQFIRIHVAGGENHIDTVVQAPMPLSDWGGLGAYQKFAARIDAVMQMPDDMNTYWVFSGQEYIRTSWSGSAWSVI
ncbi:hypothetical protein [Embleya sp. NPDC020886]|uniref:hypothetical protein n=1 Tax=Embleya sp. NPDC020886 TaxID=3363980 RepID=UPI0037A642F4